MAITKDRKKSLIGEYRVNPKDTGSSPVQIALLTERIQTLSEHFKKCPKDFGSRQGLLQMVSRRRQLLNYLRNASREDYQKIIQRLDLRK
jgi:small subunit ribosomal protein S15